MHIKDVEITPEYQQVLDHIEKDTPVILVSGQAGTGKSVLIDLISHRYGAEFNIVKAAPTGVTALNVRGSTIHSLFKLPFGVVNKDRALNQIGKMYKMGANELFEQLDILIIDEISMVRADALDAMDRILRRIRRYDYPFGGVQVILVGDLFQLPPVVTDRDQELFDKLYDIEYFFGSKAFADSCKFNMIEVVMLSKNFRQADDVFVKLLNNIRVSKNIIQCVKALNEYSFYNQAEWDDDRDCVTLCTTNKRTVDINSLELRKIQSDKRTYQATVTGTFDLKSVIAPEMLELKVGAKVMFTRNNGCEWVNGTIGLVVKLGEDFIDVFIPSDDMTVTVKRETWENIDYVMDDKTKRISEAVIGTFVQYPLTLAWAITIHKSQGLTFSKVLLDMGRGAFATGQTYVGLSRCTSIDGLHLARPMVPNDIRVDQRVVEFYKWLLD